MDNFRSTTLPPLTRRGETSMDNPMANYGRRIVNREEPISRKQYDGGAPPTPTRPGMY